MKLSLKVKVIATLFGTTTIGIPITTLYTLILFLQAGGGLGEEFQEGIMSYGILTLGVVVSILVVIHIRLLIWFLKPVTQYLESPDKTREMAFAALSASDRFPLRGSFPSVVAWSFGVIIVFLVLSRFVSFPLEEYTKIILGAFGAGIIVALFQYYFNGIVLNPEAGKILTDHPDLWKERDRWGFKLNIRRLLLFSFISLVL